PRQRDPWFNRKVAPTIHVPREDSKTSSKEMRYPGDPMRSALRTAGETKPGRARAKTSRNQGLLFARAPGDGDKKSKRVGRDFFRWMKGRATICDFSRAFSLFFSNLRKREKGVSRGNVLKSGSSRSAGGAKSGKRGGVSAKLAGWVGLGCGIAP